MNDPHVRSLTYRLKEDESVSFDNPPPLNEEFSAFRVLLDGNILTVNMKDHFPNEFEARKIVDPFLRSWELDVALSYGHSVIQFEFTKSEVIDRNPPLPGQSHDIQTGTSAYTVTVFPVSFHITRKQYPKPPNNLGYSLDVESLWKRYQGFLDGREPLLSMGSFCLSLLEWSAGGRKVAADKYMIEEKVLSKLGQLTSVRGDRSEARKLDKNSTLTSLTDNEQRWIQDAIKIIIRRKAEYDFDPESELPQITIDSLPKI